MIVGFLVDHLLNGQKQTDISLLRVVIVLYNGSIFFSSDQQPAGSVVLTNPIQ